MATNTIIVSVVFLIHIVLVAYIWPLRIAVDPDRPLTWYYPCVCGCLRDNRERRQSIKDKKDLEQNNSYIPTDQTNSELQPDPTRLLDSQKSQPSNQLLQKEELQYVADGKMEGLTGNESSDRLIISNLVKKYGKKAASHSKQCCVWLVAMVP